MKKISPLSFWLFIFFALIAVEGYSTFGQSITYRFTRVERQVSLSAVQERPIGCTSAFGQKTGGTYVVERSTVFLNPLRPDWKGGGNCYAEMENASKYLIP